MSSRVLAVVLLICSGCAGRPQIRQTYLPARDLGALFHDIQVSGMFEDSKTFADARALRPPATIAALYASERFLPNFNLRAFVERHFELPMQAGEMFTTDTSRTMVQHIRALWPVLTRPPDRPTMSSSLIPLPHAYVVPGGRFREIYYWDSYFTMLGLLESGRSNLVRAMLDNFAYLINNYGHIPNGNRTYYLSRSQPPFFGAMIGLYASATDTANALVYLDALEKEYAFWMRGQRVVTLPDSSKLNRYWDELPEPRPESYREDFTLAQTLPAENRVTFYRNVRAAAESGWDFSSRWLRDPTDLRTLETTELVPIDLNSLMYHTERTIAALRNYRKQDGDSAIAAAYFQAAERRRSALLRAAWDSASGFFYDVRWRTGERVTDRPTMAAVVPLYFRLATPAQGARVLERIQRDFLKPGGFVTSLVNSGQQWDSPNGWPPLVWLGIQAACRYQRPELARAAADRWLALNRRTYRATGKMLEKYDVIDINRAADGGEYPTQDGFGWTNGVALALAESEEACLAAA